MTSQTARSVAETMQALATPSRVRILSRLSAGPCAVGELADPIIGLVVTVVILRITWQSVQTVRADPGESFTHDEDS